MNTTARLIGLMIVALPGLAVAQSSNCEGKNNNTFNKLLECVTVEGVRAHQAVLQGIADENNGNRASGTPGYDDSVDYIRETMTAAG